MKRFNRRQFLEISAAGAGAFAAACNLETPAPRLFTHADAMIKARPGTPTETPTIGYSALGLTSPRDAMLYVPTTYVATTPAPLMILLHPNGQSAAWWEAYGVGQLLDDLGVVILAPDSRYISWDIISEHGYASDPTYISFALDYVFKRVNVGTKVAIAGFSDGGMESLGIGLANGDFITNVMAYSPGALATPWQTAAKPKIWISHGQTDPVLSFEFCRDEIAQRLTNASYNTTFVPFLGGHAIPTDIFRQSVEWFLA